MTTGRTVEEALETALDQLGVDEHDAEHEVVQEPQRGLFGRVRAEARVRARVRPAAPPPKLDRRDRRRRGRDGDRERQSRSRSRAKAGRGAGGSGGSDGSGGSPRSGGSGGSRAGEEARRESRSGAGGNDSNRGGSGSRQGGGQQRRRRRRSRTTGKAEGAGVVSESTTARTKDVDDGPLDLEAQRTAVEEFLQGLLESFGRSDATVSVAVVEDNTLEAAIDGSELGLLVGQKGATLQSLQELVRSMVQRRFVGQSHARVRVDVAGYRERRRQALERFTAEVAATVRESGVAKALDPMGPADRKVVHDAVNEIDGVETVSEGEDADRHVVIRPTA